MIAFEVDMYYSYVIMFFKKEDVTSLNIKKLLHNWYKTEGEDRKEKCKRATDYILKEFDKSVGADIAGGAMIDYYKIYTVVLEDFKMDDVWSHGILAHEIGHVTNNILERIGMKLSSESEEAYTYLTQHLTMKAYKYLIDNENIKERN